MAITWANVPDIRSSSEEYRSQQDVALSIDGDLEDSLDPTDNYGAGVDQYGKKFFANLNPAIEAGHNLLLGVGNDILGNTADNLGFYADKIVQANDVSTELANTLYT